MNTVAEANWYSTIIEPSFVILIIIIVITYKSATRFLYVRT